MHKARLLALVCRSKPAADVCSHPQKLAAQREMEPLNPARKERNSVSGSEKSEKVQVAKTSSKHEISEIRHSFTFCNVRVLNFSTSD